MATRTRVEAPKKDELDSLKTRVSARGGCPRCHKRPTKGFLKIDVIKYGEEKSAKGAKHIKSKSRSMCGTCIKEVFTKLNSEFDKEVNG